MEYGDTLASIARNYHTSTSVIADANNLPGDDVRVGSKLIIPIAPSKADAVAYSRKATHYTVRKGDTLGSVADDFQVPIDKLRKWNRLRGNTVAVGRTLIIYKPLGEGRGPEVASGSNHPASKSGKKGKSAKGGSEASANSETAATYHKVKKGETLSGIAESYNTTVANLKKNNTNLSANLRAGEVLVIRK